MSTAHVSSLAAKHANIEARLNDEQRRPQPDTVLIALLKKQKLRLKEEIAHHSALQGARKRSLAFTE
jgi:hypothetical protein